MRTVSDREFAKARARLRLPALSSRNEHLVARADSANLVPRRQGFRFVAGDAWVLCPPFGRCHHARSLAAATMPQLGRCHHARSLAAAGQRFLALYLSGAELSLHATVDSGCESERAMLANALDKFVLRDVQLLDHGYPVACAINLLAEHGIHFDTASNVWHAVRAFMPRDQCSTLLEREPIDLLIKSVDRMGVGGIPGQASHRYCRRAYSKPRHVPDKPVMPNLI